MKYEQDIIFLHNHLIAGRILGECAGAGAD
jgi:hypothetical protein